MKTALKQYLKKRVKVITAILLKPAQTYTVATIHDLRVELKKLSAIFKLVNSCSENFKREKTFKHFKRIFEQAGKLRELQLVEAMLEKYNINSSLKVYLSDLRELELNEQKEFFSIIDKKYLIKLKESCKILVSYLKKIDKKELKEFIKKNKKVIETLLVQNNFSTEQVHEVRKRLKTFYYNCQSLNLMKQNKQPLEIEALSEILGKWHDGQAMMKHLSKAISENGRNLKEANRLKVIKAKLYAEGELIFKKILSALPAAKVDIHL